MVLIETVLCSKVKLRSCRYSQFSQVDSGLSQGSSAFSIVDLTSHVQSHICQVQRQAPCSGKCACLRSHPSLALRKGATVQVVKARCQNFSSKLCFAISPLVLKSLHPRQLRKTCNPAADVF